MKRITLILFGGLVALLLTGAALDKYGLYVNSTGAILPPFSNLVWSANRPAISNELATTFALNNATLNSISAINLSGQSGKVFAVNEAETGVEVVAQSGGSGGGGSGPTVVGYSVVTITNQYAQSTVMALGNTNFTSAQGTPIITNSYTPISTTNYLEITLDAYHAGSVANSLIGAIFEGDNPTSVAAAHLGTTSAGNFVMKLHWTTTVIPSNAGRRWIISFTPGGRAVQPPGISIGQGLIHQPLAGRTSSK